MNKESNIFTLSFAVILVILVATILAVTSEVLKPRQGKNKSDKKMINILSAIHVQANRDNAKQEYAKYIFDETLIDYKGNILEGSAFDVNVLLQYKDKTLSPADIKYPLFKAKKDDKEYTIVPMAGSGLWGPIWGFVSFESDYVTIYGASFSHKKETPGLGAEINTALFEEPFKGKKIINKDGVFVSIKVKKGGAEEGNLHQVDAITGGTITSDGVSDMLYKTLDVYNSYFYFLREENQTIDTLITDTIMSINNNIDFE